MALLDQALRLSSKADDPEAHCRPHAPRRASQDEQHFGNGQLFHPAIVQAEGDVVDTTEVVDRTD
jgi:hypothetical protein